MIVNYKFLKCQYTVKRQCQIIHDRLVQSERLSQGTCPVKIRFLLPERPECGRAADANTGFAEDEKAWIDDGKA